MNFATLEIIWWWKWKHAQFNVWYFMNEKVAAWALFFVYFDNTLSWCYISWQTYFFVVSLLNHHNWSAQLAQISKYHCCHPQPPLPSPHHNYSLVSFSHSVHQTFLFTPFKFYVHMLITGRNNLIPVLRFIDSFPIKPYMADNNQYIASLGH